MKSDLSVIQLVLDAGPVVQVVMGMLMLASLMSWTLIFDRWRTLRRARLAADEFEDDFWSGGDLSTLYRGIASGKRKVNGMESIFEAGFREFIRLRKQAGVDSRAVVEGSQRAMRVALTRAMDQLESHLPFLATVGSTSPYVGLFGTVWGIMNSFQALGDVHQASIALVAPGISEALVATAMGLFAAIPAVIAYNRFAAETERLANRYDLFSEEFSSVLQRQAHSHG
ncbi:MAG: protein TolQ [Chromatiales bacterium]|nr:protein TolQ [Chromatiales bacterium]